MSCRSTTGLIALLAFASNFQQGIAQQREKCSIEAVTDKCLTPRARGSTSFEFKPLFPTNPTFVYAFDVQDESEANQDAILPGSTPSTEAKVAFWLEYSDSKLTPTDHQETYMAVLLNGNITGTPGGAHNGCDDALGTECANNLVEFLEDQITTARMRAFADLDSVLDNLKGPFPKSKSELAAAIQGLGCPSGLFEVSYLVSGAGGSVNEAGKLAKENGDSTRIMPSGSAADPYIVENIRNVTYDKLIDGVAVGLLARIPLEGELYQEADNIQLQMVCTKAKPLEGREESPGDGEDDEDADRQFGKPNDAAQPIPWTMGPVMFVMAVAARVAL